MADGPPRTTELPEVEDVWAEYSRMLSTHIGAARLIDIASSFATERELAQALGLDAVVFDSDLLSSGFRVEPRGPPPPPRPVPP